MVPNIKTGQNGVREPETLCPGVEMAVGLVAQCHYFVLTEAVVVNEPCNCEQ